MSATSAATAEFQDAGKPVARPVYLVDNAGNPISLSAIQGQVALYNSNPATTGVATDAAIKFGANGTQQVNHVLIANNTSGSINYELDAVTTAASDVLAAGQKIMFDIQTFVVHLQAGSNVNINGSTSGNIVVRGWL